jgi:hypothetical protein
VQRGVACITAPFRILETTPALGRNKAAGTQSGKRLPWAAQV